MAGFKESQALVRQLRAEGYETQMTKRGHVKVYWGDQVVGCVPGTPGDRRSLKNSLAQVRRNRRKLEGVA